VTHARKRTVVRDTIRLSDIAREAGVSTATVSRVINGLSYVSQEVRERVLEVVRRHDYYPNAHARSLASGRSNIIGLVISDIANPFFPELVKGMETAAFDQGCELILANTNYEAGRLSNYVRRFIERGVGGVAMMTSEVDPAITTELARRNVSVVCLDSGEPGAHVSNLMVDYESGIDQAVAHLAALGHRRIAFVGGPSGLRSAERRLTAFRESLRHRLDADPVAVVEGDFRLESGRDAARALLALAPPATAVVCANDMMALGVMQECRSAGVAIPGDLSLIGFDDIAIASLTEPALTTVSLSREELGREAVAALMATINHAGHRGVEIPIATTLVVRRSTARV
jgi:LacI family transcriptional regulator